MLRQRPSSRAAPQFPLTRRTGSRSFRTESTPAGLGLLPPSTSTLLPPGHPQITAAPQHRLPALQGDLGEEPALRGCVLLVSSPSNPKSDLLVLEPPHEKRNPAGHQAPSSPGEAPARDPSGAGTPRAGRSPTAPCTAWRAPGHTPRLPGGHPPPGPCRHPSARPPTARGPAGLTRHLCLTRPLKTLGS